MPQASTASHVLVVVLAHAVPLVISPPTCTTVEVLQTSLAVGAVKDGVAVHSIVAFAPADPIAGACVSVCVIVWDLVADELPQASTASHVLVVVFAHAVPPVTSPPTCTTVAVLHASLAIGAVKDGVAVHSIVVFAPADPIAGACVSVCVIVWDTVVLELPHASTALQVLVIVFAQAVPPVTSLPDCTTVTLLQASEAVGAVNDAVPVHSIVILAPCPPIVGGVVSPKEIV